MTCPRQLDQRLATVRDSSSYYMLYVAVRKAGNSPRTGSTPFTVTLKPPGQSSFSDQPKTCMFWDCGGKPEYLE